MGIAANALAIFALTDLSPALHTMMETPTLRL